MLLICIGLVLAFNVTNYMLTTYMPTYLTAEVGYTHAQALLMVLASMVVVMELIVLLGWFSDRIVRLPVLTAGCGFDRARVTGVHDHHPGSPVGRAPRSPDDRSGADLLQQHRAVDASSSVPHPGALRRRVRGLQYLRCAVRRYETAHLRSAGQRYRQLDDTDGAADGRRRGRPGVRDPRAGAQAAAAFLPHRELGGGSHETAREQREQQGEDETPRGAGEPPIAPQGR
ncbi:hypothetical protein [Salinifilum ghardaiensis]